MKVNRVHIVRKGALRPAGFEDFAGVCGACLGRLITPAFRKIWKLSYILQGNNDDCHRMGLLCDVNYLLLYFILLFFIRASVSRSASKKLGTVTMKLYMSESTYRKALFLFHVCRHVLLLNTCLAAED